MKLFLNGVVSKSCKFIFAIGNRQFGAGDFGDGLFRVLLDFCDPAPQFNPGHDLRVA